MILSILMVEKYGMGKRLGLMRVRENALCFVCRNDLPRSDSSSEEKKNLVKKALRV